MAAFLPSETLGNKWNKTLINPQSRLLRRNKTKPTDKTNKPQTLKLRSNKNLLLLNQICILSL